MRSPSYKVLTRRQVMYNADADRMIDTLEEGLNVLADDGWLLVCCFQGASDIEFVFRKYDLGE